MQYFFLAYYNYVFWPISFSIYLFNNIFLFLNIIRKSKKKKTFHLVTIIQCDKTR